MNSLIGIIFSCESQCSLLNECNLVSILFDYRKEVKQILTGRCNVLFGRIF